PEGLLELMNPGHGGMRDLICEADPRAARRESLCRRREAGLIFGIELHRIVELEHVVVVARPDGFSHADSGEQVPFAGQRRRQAGPEPTCDRSKLLADLPPPGLAIWVHVAEHAENALPRRRLRRETIDVQPRVVLPPGLLPTRDFDRPQACLGLLQLVAVR